MRLFVAIIPPPEVREGALREARSLSWRGSIRWLQPENVHLTLKFLGETPEPKMQGLRDALEAACGGHLALDLELTGAGAFPSVERARVLWVGVGEGSDRLRALAEDVEDALESLGFEREKRPFHPHATVGRARDGDARLEDSKRETDLTDLGPLLFRARSVDLVRSHLSRKGAVYSTIASYPLREGSPSPGLYDGEERPDRHQDEEKYQNHGD